MRLVTRMLPAGLIALLCLVHSPNASPVSIAPTRIRVTVLKNGLPLPRWPIHVSYGANPAPAVPGSGTSLTLPDGTIVLNGVHPGIVTVIADIPWASAVPNPLTQRVDGVSTVGGQLAAIEPRTNYSVIRIQRDNTDGQGDVGLMLTGVNRDLDAGSSPYLRNSAYVGGLDLRRRFFNNNYEVRTFAAMSNVSGTADAIAALQRNTVHAYQRPDDGIAYDPTRTTISGDAERLSISKFGGGVTRFQSVYQRFSPGFESNDLGYQQRAD